MPECDHCGATFDAENPYLDHLESEHPDDLGAIERRRLDDRHASGDGLPMGPIAIGGVLLITAGVLAYLLVFSGGGSDGPQNVGSVHYHGTINVTIEGEQIDFSKQQYQVQDDAFHFEGGVGDRWHVHAQQVRLAYALSTLGIEINETSVTFDGDTYRDGVQGQSVSVTVNGDPVDPDSYVLQKGDHVRIVANAG